MAGGFWGGGFIYIGVSGQEGFDLKIRQLATWGQSITSLEEPLTEIGHDFQADFMQNMASEGGLYGGWAPLAASTIEDRLRKGYGAGPILVRTMRLANSLAGQSADSIFAVTPTTLRVGTNDPKAPYHQRGTRKMPKRQIVGVTWFRRQMIVRRIGDWVREQARLAGVG